MAGEKFTDRQLDQIAELAGKGFLAELNGDKAEADVQYRRAQMVTNTARNSNKQK
jgi:hypothetical protein